MEKLMGLSMKDALLVLQADSGVDRWKREHGDKLPAGQVPFEGGEWDPRSKAEIVESRLARDRAWLTERGFR